MPKARWSNITVLLAAFAVALLPLLATNVTIFGKATAVPQDYAASINAEQGDATEGEGFLSPGSLNFKGVLFSGRNGLFSHHPALVLAAIGLLWTACRWRERREVVVRFVLPLGLAFLVQLSINAATADWWGGHAFGQRRLVSSLPWFALGFCAIYEEAVRRLPGGKNAAHALVVLVVALNLYLTAIHVFMWSYDESHDVLNWLFVRAPEWLRHQLSAAALAR